MFFVKHKAVLLALLLIPAVITGYGQVRLGNNLKLSGNFSLQYQYYTFNTENGAFGFPRQPEHLPQFSSVLNLQINDKISIPVQIYLRPIIKVSGFGVNTPVETDKRISVLDYLLHPVNQIYANPSFGNLELKLGHFIDPYSELSAGDIKIFGMGARYRFGDRSVAIQRGLIQSPVANTAFNFSNGAYRRSLTAVDFTSILNEQLKYGLSLAYVADNPNSLDSIPLFRRPEKSAVLSVRANYKLNKKSDIGLEIANTAYAPNLFAPDTAREFSLPSLLIRKTSVLTGLGFALKGNTEIRGIRLKGNLKYKTRNFRTLAYPFMQSDILDIELRPGFSLLNNAWQSNLKLAYLGNNISNKQATSLRIPILQYSGYYRYNESAYVNLTLSFNAVNSAPDTAGNQIKTSTGLLRLTPTYIFRYKGLEHVVSLIAGYNKYVNKSSFLFQETSVSTTNWGIVYRVNIGIYSAGLSLSTLGTSSGENKLLRNNNLTISGQAKLMNNRLIPYLRLTFTGARAIGPNGLGSDLVKAGGRQVRQLGLRYTVNNKIQASIGFGQHVVKQGTGSKPPIFRENILRFGVSYSL